MDHFLVDYENIGEAGLKGIEDIGPDTSTVIFYSEHADKISFDMHQVLCRCRSRLEFRKAQTGKKNALDFQLSTYLGYLVASHPGDRFFIISKDNGYHVVMDFWDKANVQQLDYIGRAYEKPVRQTQNPAPQPLPPAEKRPEEHKVEPSAKPEAKAQPEQQTKAEPRTQPEQPEKPVIRRQPEHQERPEIPSQEDKPASAEDVKGADVSPAAEETAPETEKRTHRGGRRRNSGSREPQADEFRPSEELMNSLSELIENEEERRNIGRFIVKYKTKQGVNNAIVKMYGTEKAGELYRKIKPLLKDKKGK